MNQSIIYILTVETLHACTHAVTSSMVFSDYEHASIARLIWYIVNMHGENLFIFWIYDCIFGIGPCIDSFIPFNYKVVVPPPRSLASWDGSQANSRYRAKWSSVLVFCKTSLYIWGHVMSLSTTSFLFWMHALMHGTSMHSIYKYVYACILQRED